MKTLFVALLLVSVGAIAQSSDDTRPHIYKPQAVGWLYGAICYYGLEGNWVQSNPNFYQSWSCEGVGWCKEQPETFGCRIEEAF